MWNQDSKEPLEVQYELASTIYANAVIDEPKTILLWLGVWFFIVACFFVFEKVLIFLCMCCFADVQADTLVEYEIGEAIEMLQEQLTTTRNLINQLSAGMLFIKRTVFSIVTQCTSRRPYRSHIFTRSKEHYQSQHSAHTQLQRCAEETESKQIINGCVSFLNFNEGG